MNIIYFIYLFIKALHTSTEGLWDTWSYSLFKVVTESVFEKVEILVKPYTSQCIHEL